MDQEWESEQRLEIQYEMPFSLYGSQINFPNL